MEGQYLETLTWDEAEAALKRYPVLLLPLGAGCKEHGLHLPLNTDAILAEKLTRRLVERCPVLALPALSYGYYPAFVEYPGSAHVRREAFRDTVVDIAKSFARHGARRFYVLNTGISTNWGLEPARQALAEDGIVMEYTDLHETAREAIASVKQEAAGTHADEIETSKLLYLAPEVVRMERARKDLHAEERPGPLTRDPNKKRGLYSPTGAWGDPTLASAEKGRVVFEAAVEELAAFLARFAKPEYRPAPVRAKYMP
ncbi:MAG: creatininase family protein [Planctomycetota bacterium]|nr:creatininase family protein [Planctomycetota bacterium]